MTELMNAGVELMLVGMGIVFLFLAMLIVTVNLMSALVLRFFPEPPAEVVPVAEGTGDPHIIAAISAAIKRYRSDHQ